LDICLQEYGVKDQKAPALSSEVFATLKDRIIHWDYSPAHRLTEEELCDEFGVSRSPIREALHMLVESGLVTKVSHRGYAVRQPDAKEIHDLYDVRQALELFIVEWLAIHGMPEAEWNELTRTWQSILENLPQVTADFAQNDEAFHEKLAETTGNKAVIQYLHNVNERLHFIRMTDITTVARLRSTCEQHLQILKRIRSGEVQKAREAMRENIEGGRQKVEEAFKEALARSFHNQPKGEY